MILDDLDDRSAFGAIGLYGVCVCSAVIVFTLVIVFAPAQNTPLDSFVRRHIDLLRGTLWATFFASLITFLCVLYGRGRQRAFGLALSIVNFLFSLSILGAGA
jgi:uncharacterized membrane protein